MSIFREDKAAPEPQNEEKEDETVEEYFTSRLERTLIDRGIKKRDFAKSVGIAPNTLSGYLTAQHMPDLPTLRNICEKLSISSDYLIGLSDNPNIDTGHTPNENELLAFYRLISEKYQNEVIGEVKGIVRFQNRNKQ